MNTTIVYYSLEGNCAYVAERIAEETGASLLRIEPEKAYPDSGFKKFFWGGKSAVMAEQPKLKPYTFDAGKTERVIFGFPVWAGTITPPLRSFIAENKTALQGKKIAAFACQSGAGAPKALGKLKELLGISELEAELVLVDPKAKPNPDNEVQIAAFCEKLEALRR